MSNVETRTAVPAGVTFFAKVAVDRVQNPPQPRSVEEPLLLTSGLNPQQDTLITPLSEPKVPHIVHTKLKGVRPTEFNDARLFQTDVYREPARAHDEFDRTPSNRTRRRAEAREKQRLLEKTGKSQAEALAQSRKAVDLNLPLKDRLTAKRVAVFEAKKQITLGRSSLQTDTNIPDVNPDTENAVGLFKLNAAFEEMYVEQVAPAVTKYIDTLETSQEKAMAAAFLTHIFTIGAANLTPQAQIELIEMYQKRQTALAGNQTAKRSHMPPARVAGLLLAAGLGLALLAGCMPDTQSQSTADAQNGTPGLSEQQEVQNGQPTQNPPNINVQAETAPNSTAEIPGISEPQPSPTPQMIEIASLDDSPATREQQAELTELFSRLTTGDQPVISGANDYRGIELNDALWIEDANPENPSLNNGYGRTPDDVVKIFADESLDFYIARTSEINDFMTEHGLEPAVENFNISLDGRLLGVDDEGNPLATRFTFEKDDGTTVAVFIPTDAQALEDGYTFGGNFYKFDPISGQFTQESIATPTPESSSTTPSLPTVTSTSQVVPTIENPTPTLPSTQEGSNNAEIIQSFLTDPSITLDQIDPIEFYSETAGGQLLDPSYISTEINTPPGLPIELNVITVTPILLDIYMDEEKTYLVLGAQDTQGQPFVYVTTTGFLDHENYPTYDVTRSLKRGNTNGSPPINYSPPDGNANITFKEIPNPELKEYLDTEIGKPIKVVLNAIAFTDGSTGGSIPGMSDLEESQLRQLTNPSMLEVLIGRYNGEESGANFIINDGSQIANGINPDIAPLVGQIEPILD